MSQQVIGTAGGTDSTGWVFAGRKLLCNGSYSVFLSVLMIVLNGVQWLQMGCILLTY
jgi:hypothetical protein